MIESETIPAVTAEPGQVIEWNGLAFTVARVDVKSSGWVILHPRVGNAVVVAPGCTVRVVGRSS